MTSEERTTRVFEGSGGEGGILTQPLLLSYHLFSSLHQNRMNIGDFCDPPVLTLSTFPHE